MNNLSGIKIISLDLFRTLVAVDDNYKSVWKVFLGENYTDEKGLKYWNRAGELISSNIEAMKTTGGFRNVNQIFEDSYVTLLAEIGLDYDPKKAADVVSGSHKKQPLFDDVKPFFKRIEGKYNVCLSTDADYELLEDYKNIFPFDNLFISEEIKAYKSDMKFFSHLLDYYKMPPEQILHIGDSHRDIVQPKKLGIQTCWINRDNQEWKQDIMPDYEVKSLLEIADLLG